MIKVSDYIIGRLEKLGSDRVFMLPGGGAMHLNDSLRKSPRLRFTCCQNEQGAAIAAEAYSRVTGTPGLLMVTTGPGGTNAMTGVAGAWLESTPVFVVSGQVKTADMAVHTPGLRQQGMQELDVVSMARPITKYATVIMDPMDVKFHVDRAIMAMSTGRPGPVWLDVPLDVQASMIDEDDIRIRADMLSLRNPVVPAPYVNGIDEDTMLDVAEALGKAKRPVILAGNGIRLAGGITDFTEMAKAYGIPVLTTWGGIDLLSEDDPLYFGRPGGLGHRYANFIIQNADCLLSIGARMNLLQTGFNHEGFARDAIKIQVDIDQAELRKANVHPDMAICADAKAFCRAMLAMRKHVEMNDLPGWLAYAMDMRRKYPISRGRDTAPNALADPYALLDALSDALPEDAIYVSGSSGSCIDVSMQAFRVKQGQRAFCTKGLASMGYGLPSAIGAALAGNGRQVASVMGDGGFVMNVQELETLRRLDLDVKIFVLCNGGYGAITATQTNLFGGNLIACGPNSGLTLPNPCAIAAAYGIRTDRIESNGAVRAGVERVLGAKGPVVCAVATDIRQTASPKQMSYMRSDGQMESLPIEFMSPALPDGELEANMIVPMYERK